MFEDQTNREPEDIFSGTDPGPAQKQPMAQPSQPPAQQAAPASMPPSPADLVNDDSPASRKMVIVAIVVVILILLLVAVLAGIWLTRRGAEPVDLPSQNIPATEQPQQPVDEAPAVPEEPVPLDTDGDGLLDEMEEVYGTSPDQADTDQDGLNDAEEVRVWRTDPLNPDTDNDTYRDGDEVKSGYDPRQAGGVLLNIEDAQK